MGNFTQNPKSRERSPVMNDELMKDLPPIKKNQKSGAEEGTGCGSKEVGHVCDVTLNILSPIPFLYNALCSDIPMV